MASSLPPNPMRPAVSRAPAQPVLSPKQWEQTLKVQRMSQVLPDHVGSGLNGMELRPRNVHFATQNKGEKVFILLRRHFVTNMGWIVSNTLYLFLPPLLYFLVSLFNKSVTEFASLKVIGLIVFIFYSLIFTNVLRLFVDWYFNIYIVTDERVICYYFKPFVSRDITELTLDDIEDIKEVGTGVLASFFNYGDVSVYTAADNSVITFHFIPFPTLVRDKIADLSKVAKGFRHES